MKLANLETFLLLARLRHFGRTAEQLNTTQPAVSSRIAALERELGVQLIDREGRQFQLTAAGRQALEVTEKLLADFQNLKLGFSKSTTLTGPLRIGAIDSIVQTWLPRFFERLRETYPGAQIAITIDSTIDLLAAMRAGDLDMSFCLDPVLEQGYRSFVICNYAMAWVGSPKLIDRDRVYSVAELGAMPLITFPRSSPPYRMIAPYFQDESVLASQLSNSNSLPTMIRLASEGFGVAAVPAICVQKEIAAGELVATRVAKSLPHLSVIANYRPGPDAAVLERIAEIAKASTAEFLGGVDAALAWA